VTDTVIPGNEREVPEADPGSEREKKRAGDEDRLTYFIRMLTDDDEVNRWKAAESLGRTGDSRAVESLIEALWDDDSRVRLKAAWALGRIGDPRAIAPLKRLYRMEKEEMQEIISEALEEINLQITG
jgi:HEAT repeat protein